MTVFPLFPLIISLIAVAISIYAAYTQYTYARAEYKRDPVIGNPSGEFFIEERVVDGEVSRFAMMHNIDIDITEENNLEGVYMISPNFEIEELPGEDYVEEAKAYLNAAFQSSKPDLEIGGYLYFYRFVLFEGLDDKLDLNLFYLKTEEFGNEEPTQFTFNKIDRINLLQIKNGFPKDPSFEGERKMAEQYDEIFAYYQEYA